MTLTVSPVPSPLAPAPVPPDAGGGATFAPLIQTMLDGNGFTPDCTLLPPGGENLPGLPIAEPRATAVASAPEAGGKLSAPPEALAEVALSPAASCLLPVVRRFAPAERRAGAHERPDASPRDREDADDAPPVDTAAPPAPTPVMQPPPVATTERAATAPSGATDGQTPSSPAIASVAPAPARTAGDRAAPAPAAHRSGHAQPSPASTALALMAVGHAAPAITPQSPGRALPSPAPAAPAMATGEHAAPVPPSADAPPAPAPVAPVVTAEARAAAAMPSPPTAESLSGPNAAPTRVSPEIAPPDAAPAVARVTSAAPDAPPPVAAAAPAILPALQAFGAAMRQALADERKPLRREGGADLAAPAPALLTPSTPAQPVAHDSPTLDTADRRWPHAMAEQIERLRDAANESSTRIRLLPDALGSVDVAVRRDGEQIHVHFTAAQAETRQLLLDAQPRLADAADARGLRLGRTEVSADVPANGSGDRQQQRAPAQPPRSTHPAPARTRAAATDTDDTRIA